MERVTVTIEFGDKRITLEGPERFVRSEVERLALLRDEGQATDDVPPLTKSDRPLSEKALYESKRPANHSEAVAVFGFWLAENGQPEFTEDDVRKMYIRAGVRPPKVVSQALRDAKNKFDYIETGSSRGLFRVSHHGDRTVRFDLPRSE